MASSRELFKKQAELFREYEDIGRALQSKLADIAEVQRDLSIAIDNENSELMKRVKEEESEDAGTEDTDVRPEQS